MDKFLTLCAPNRTGSYGRQSNRRTLGEARFSALFSQGTGLFQHAFLTPFSSSLLEKFTSQNFQFKIIQPKKFSSLRVIDEKFVGEFFQTMQ